MQLFFVCLGKVEDAFRSIKELLCSCDICLKDFELVTLQALRVQRISGFVAKTNSTTGKNVLHEKNRNSIEEGQAIKGGDLR